MGNEKVDIAFIRMDRIGDLVLSLPVDQYPGFMNLNTHWLISSGLSFILKHSHPQRPYSEMKKDFSLKNAKELYCWLRKNKPKAAVVFYAPWWVSFILCLARVPLRIGRYSQWHSFLFFNRGLRQKRSRSEKHEMDYNFDLANLYFKNPAPFQFHGRLNLKAKKSKSILNKHGLGSKEYYVIHPGMGGSALNWPTDHYVQLIQNLCQKSMVVITGTHMDRQYLEPLQEKLKSQDNLLWLNERLTTEELIAVLHDSKAVVAPSTGVVHLAASCGTPTIGIYSPIVAESSRRWGPKGERVIVLEAKDQMSSISVQSVCDSIDKLSELQ